jgi:hypothetical protein
MKKLTMLFAISALALMVGPLSAQPQGTTTITFDGFCDGFTLNVSGLVLGGTHNNYDCAGSNTIVGGDTSVDFLLQPRPLGKSSRANVTSEVGPILLGCDINYYLDFSNNSWSLYLTCAGEPEALGNKGTFTITPPAAGAAKHASRSTIQTINQQPDPDAGTEAGIPQGNFDISFDGFCDGMNLNAKGTKLGGTLTGCYTGIAGGNTAQEQAGIVPGDSNTANGANINSSIANPCVLTYALYWGDLTWANYLTCAGEVSQLINVGTFTFAPPPPPAAGLRPSAARH